MRTNVTMLYGHIETAEERVDHMLRTRALQDETGGLQAFIPLAFHPDNNQMRKLPAPSGVETLRVLAVSRLMLDNVPHIKGFWIATGVEVAQLSLWFGVSDLDGTVQEERIYHMAGSDRAGRGEYIGAPPPHPVGRPRSDRAGHAVQRRDRSGCARRTSRVAGPGARPRADRRERVESSGLGARRVVMAEGPAACQ